MSTSIPATPTINKADENCFLAQLMKAKNAKNFVDAGCCLRCNVFCGVTNWTCGLNWKQLLILNNNPGINSFFYP